MRLQNARTPIALVVVFAFLSLASTAVAAVDGEVEFTPGGPTAYLSAAPTINWAAYGALTGATCQFSKLTPAASTPFPTNSCTAAVPNAPTVNSASAPTFTSYSWPTASMTSGDGRYRVTYVPTFASHPSVTAERDFVIDTVSPVVTASAPTGVTTNNRPQLGYTMYDLNPDRVECSIDPVNPLDPNEYSVCPASPFLPAALADGEHKFYVVGYDLAQRLSVAVRVFTVDATGPVITVAGLSQGATITSAWPAPSVSSTDVGAGVASTTCAYDAATPVGCNDPVFLNTPLADGAHTLSIRATDLIGNVSIRTVSFSVAVSGRWKEGLAAPKKAKFAIKRGRLSATFALPAGSAASTCSGKATISAKLKKKQLGSAKARFKKSGSKCVASAKPKLSKRFKGKKLTVTIAYTSGPINAFTLRGRAKL